MSTCTTLRGACSTSRAERGDAVRRLRCSTSEAGQLDGSTVVLHARMQESSTPKEMQGAYLPQLKRLACRSLVEAAAQCQHQVTLSHCCVCCEQAMHPDGAQAQGVVVTDAALHTEQTHQQHSWVLCSLLSCLLMDCVRRRAAGGRR